jgi:hypothetical protein
MTRRGFAADTKVPAFQSRADIEKMLAAHRCSQYGTAIDYTLNTARVQFRAYDRVVRFVISLPKRDMRNFDQLERQRWRQLLLVIKAKLEAVENQIATFEEEFLAHVVLPNDQTVGPILAPMIAAAYQTGHMPEALRALPAKGETGRS